MTTEQYKHEVTQNMLDAYMAANTEEEKVKALEDIHECFTAFWTDDRKRDYVKYYKLPEGSVCPRFKRG